MCRQDRFFGHRLGPLAGFVLGSFGLIIGWQFAGPLRTWMVGVTDHLLFYAVLGLVTWCCTRTEGVRFDSIGLQYRHLVPAVVGGCVLLLGCNLAGIALAAGLDSGWGLAVL